MRERLILLAALMSCVLVGTAWAQETAPSEALPATPLGSVGFAWVERPHARNFAANYPARARHNGISGAAVMSCLIGEDGRLDCAVESESPEGQGFGEASVRISRRFLAPPETSAGTPTAGMRVRLPIVWQLR